MREGLSAMQVLDQRSPVGVSIVSLTTSLQSVVSNASGGDTRLITSCLLCNNTGGAITVTLEFLPSGASTGAAYQMAFSLAANTIVEAVGNGGWGLATGEVFSAKAGTGSNSVTMKVTYFKETGT